MSCMENKRDYMREENRIPKVIHYVWLGGGKMSPDLERCVRSWREVMPDYEIKRWDESAFDTDSLPWVKEAIEKRKWSLASDYIRHYALYTEGGIYMDTDVEVLKPFDEFLHWDFFSSVEYHPRTFRAIGRKQVDGEGRLLKEGDVVEGLGLLSALFGARKGHPFVRDCMEYYKKRHFVREDGSMDLDVINPGIMATIAATRYGFRFKDTEQRLGEDGGMMIYDSSVFASSGWYADRKVNYAVHYADGSWRDYTWKQKMVKRIKRWVSAFVRRRIG